MSGKKINKKVFKHGSVSVLITVLVLAAVILVNGLVSALANKYPLSYTIDLTDEGLYTISDECKAFIDTYLQGDDTKIKIYFCKERDQLDADGQYVVMVRTLIELFANNYDNLSVEYIDIYKNPSFAKKYTRESGVELYTSHIIVENEATGQFRQLSPNAFFTTAESTGNLYGFRGEITLCNAIIRVSGEKAPAVTFTMNHSETTNSSLASLLYDAGFEINAIDLSVSEIPENTKMLVISNPAKDFAGYFKEDTVTPSAETNEIQRIADYLLTKNHLVVMVNPTTPDLPNLRELLGEWGLDYMVGTRLYDFSNSVGTDGKSLVAQYYMGTGEEDDTYTSTAAYAIHRTVSQLTNPPKAVVRDAVPLVLDYNSSANVQPVLTSYSTALAFNSEMNPSKDDENSLNQALGHDEYVLMAASTQQEYVGEAGAQALQHTMVVLVGSTDFGADAYVGTGSYGNQEMFYQMARLMGSQSVPNGLSFKKFETQALDITAGQARTWTVIISVVVPLAIALCGLYIWRKRRHQ